MREGGSVLVTCLGARSCVRSRPEAACAVISGRASFVSPVQHLLYWRGLCSLELICVEKGFYFECL